MFANGDPDASDVSSSTTKVSSSATLNIEKKPDRGWTFWCIILSLAIPLILTAVEITAIGTALPMIVEDLHGTQLIWVGSAYILAATALLPFCGGLAQTFGRRAVMLGALALFCAGSTICGAATSMGVLVAGRIVQGLGGGAITSLTQIIIADLVPLRERGTFNGIMALAWSMGGGFGPVIGGSLAQKGQWRWLFYLNIPVCGIAAVFIISFLHLKTPSMPLCEQLKRMDWTGNAILVLASTLVVLGLSWGGIEYSWRSAPVLIPLIFGLVGLAAFLLYEGYFANYPIVPMSLMKDKTAISGYSQNFLMTFVLASLCYWIPVYFQACKNASPIASGVDAFGLSFTTSPMAVISGVIVQRTKNYRSPMWFGWVAMILGTALLSTLGANGSRAKAIGYEILVGTGMGIIWVAAYFPVLAPIPVNKSTPALAFHMFLRNFAMVWGITVTGAIIQNQLRSHLPSEFLAEFPGGTEIAFSVIPLIPSLPQPLNDEVRNAFASAMTTAWRVLVGISGLGLIASLFMKHLPLHTDVDEDWGIDGKRRSQEKYSRVPSIDI